MEGRWSLCQCGRPYHRGGVLKIEVEQAGDKARGQGVKVGFKVFHQLMLQLNPDFDMRALDVFITPKVVDKVVDIMEEEVAATWRTAPGVARTSGGGVTTKTRASTRVLKAIDTEDTIDG